MATWPASGVRTGLDWCGYLDARQQLRAHLLAQRAAGARVAWPDDAPADAAILAAAEQALRRSRRCRRLGVDVGELVALRHLYDRLWSYLRLALAFGVSQAAERQLRIQIAEIEATIVAAGRALDRSRLVVGRRRAGRDTARREALAYVNGVLAALRELTSEEPRFETALALRDLLARIADRAVRQGDGLGRARQRLGGFRAVQLDEIVAQLLFSRTGGWLRDGQRFPWRKIALQAVGELDGRIWEAVGPSDAEARTPVRLVRRSPTNAVAIERAISRERRNPLSHK